MTDCPAGEHDFFESKVRPLLITHCYECHSLESGESAGELRLDTRSASRRGGARGPAVVPGNVETSLLLKAVSYEDAELEMPPDGKLADEEIEILRHWIAEGAADPRSEEEPQPAAAASKSEDDTDHWAFQTPEPAVAPHIPETPPSPAANDLLDRIVQQRLQASEFEMAEPADRETLASRLYYDLTGLPAPPEALERFVNDRHPAAVQRLVDRLLASPEFGERFARHWLDVARYANTVGYTLAGRERLLKGSERYRDWVVGAFNEDLPYDQMVRYQLAADRLDPENEAGHLDAMGFLTVGRQFLSKHDTIDDRIDVISRGLLGLTVSCARCHDHKFDPIPTADYYSWVGIMESSRTPEDGKSPLMLVDENPHDAHVLIRGQRGNRGEQVPRQYLTAFREENEPPFQTGSGRLDLAERIVRSDNPLSSRVMVNRIWGHLFGKPLVTSASDFGVRTDPPAHPEVLDDLAADFVRDWSVKRIARRIVTTRIYGQRSQTADAAYEKDPDNQLLARANRRRRDFESLRDGMLVAGNYLQRRLGGDPVDITVTPVIPRRTLYAFVDRQDLPGAFRTFDFASPDAHTPERAYTTVPQQALYLMNGPLAMEMATEATRIARQNVSQEVDGPREPSAEILVDAVFQQVLRRSPSDRERQLAVQFVKTASSKMQPIPDPRAIWAYGYSSVREDGTAKSFTPLPQYRDGRWQGGDSFPDEGLSYTSLTRDGGHPGSGSEMAVNRRWTVPADGTCEVIGQLVHPSMEGNGVRFTIAVEDQKIWQTDLEKRKQPFETRSFEVRKGQQIDFIADDRGNPSHDSFQSKIAIHFEGDNGERIDADSADDFSGPFSAASAQSLDRLSQLAHGLLMSNEFIFVD